MESFLAGVEASGLGDRVRFDLSPWGMMGDETLPD